MPGEKTIRVTEVTALAQSELGLSQSKARKVLMLARANGTIKPESEEKTRAHLINEEERAVLWAAFEQEANAGKEKPKVDTAQTGTTTEESAPEVEGIQTVGDLAVAPGTENTAIKPEPKPKPEAKPQKSKKEGKGISLASGMLILAAVAAVGFAGWQYLKHRKARVKTVEEAQAAHTQQPDARQNSKDRQAQLLARYEEQANEPSSL